MRTLLVCSILVLCYPILVCAQKYETEFFEGDFKSTTVIPNSVFVRLRNDKNVKDCIKAGADQGFTNEWFNATLIDLNSDKRPDLLVQASKGCLAGNAIGFWFFSNIRGSYKEVLFDYTLLIKIRKRKTKGFYNIETSRSTGSETFIRKYIFDGRKYIRKSYLVVPIR